MRGGAEPEEVIDEVRINDVPRVGVRNRPTNVSTQCMLWQRSLRRVHGVNVPCCTHTNRTLPPSHSPQPCTATATLTPTVHCHCHNHRYRHPEHYSPTLHSTMVRAGVCALVLAPHRAAESACHPYCTPYLNSRDGHDTMAMTARQSLGDVEN